MKIILFLSFIAILAALAGAGFFMLKKGSGNRADDMVKSLAVRVGLSIALFLFILLAYQMGWIEPKGIAAGR